MSLGYRLCSGVLSVAFVSACGGGGSGTGAGTLPPMPSGGISGNPSGSGTYQDANSTANVTSTLSGGAIIARTGTLQVTTSPVSGSVNHSTDATRISDANYVFFDPDGEDAVGSLMDGNGANAAVNTLSPGYNYSAFYIMNYTAGGVFSQADGAIGIATDSADMPGVSTATYSGDVLGGYIQGANLVEFGGIVNVDADFAAKTVNAAISANGFKDPIGTPVSGAFDTINVNNMSIGGSGFSGGDLTTALGGSAVNITGASTTTTSAGSFFGFDTSTNKPAEVGGAVGAIGNSGSIGAVFIAK